MLISMLLAKFRRWRRSRETMRELARLTDRELQDLGISRFDIASVAKRQARTRN